MARRLFVSWHHPAEALGRSSPGAGPSTLFRTFLKPVSSLLALTSTRKTSSTSHSFPPPISSSFFAASVHLVFVELDGTLIPSSTPDVEYQPPFYRLWFCFRSFTPSSIPASLSCHSRTRVHSFFYSLFLLLRCTRQLVINLSSVIPPVASTRFTHPFPSRRIPAIGNPWALFCSSSHSGSQDLTSLPTSSAWRRISAPIPMKNSHFGGQDSS